MSNPRPTLTALLAAAAIGAPLGIGSRRHEMPSEADQRHARLNMEAAQEKRRKRAEKIMNSTDELRRRNGGK